MKFINLSALIIAVAFFSFFTNSIFAQISDDERRSLEQKLEQLEAEIDQHESTIQNLKNQGKSLSSEISRLNAKVNKINLQIKAVNLQLSQLDREINDKKDQIQETETKIDFNKGALGHALQEIYETTQLGLVEILFRNPKLSDFFGDINNLIDVQDSISITINRITDLKNELLDTKELLSLKRDDAAALRQYQDSQKITLNRTKEEKSDLLTATKGEEAKYKEILQETKKTAAEIRSQIFKLLGGGELSFEQAYSLAKLAEGSTGVRAALIMAVLDRESALGRNVGRCSYHTAMHPRRDIPHFLEITKKLNINPESIQVSCPNSDGVYGGAMGPAQFIPSTWVLYEKGIASVTGNNPPSPWRNADAFVATGLYLKDSLESSGCINYAEKYDHILPYKTLQERCAAAKYYAGSRWFTYRFAYGDPVVQHANEFQKDIDILNG